MDDTYLPIVLSLLLLLLVVRLSRQGDGFLGDTVPFLVLFFVACVGGALSGLEAHMALFVALGLTCSYALWCLIVIFFFDKLPLVWRFLGRVVARKP